MSVTFTIRGVDTDHDNPAPGTYANLSNANAREVLALLGFTSDENLCGTVRGRHLREACARAIAALTPKADGFRPGVVDGGDGPVCIHVSRDGGYLSRRLADLRAMADRAGDLGVVCWH